MKINIENIKAAYKEADESGMEILRILVPNLEEIVPVEDRIKTFTDAYIALGRSHPLIENFVNLEHYDENLFAFVRLRIICAALNEGWIAKSEDNGGYYPGFKFFTSEEVKRVKGEAVYDLHFLEPKFDTKYVAVDCTFTSSLTLENCLLLKTPELAKYCGKRFIGLWMDYLLPIKGNNQE